MKPLKIFLITGTICLLSWGGYSFFIKEPQQVVIPPAPNKFVEEIKLNITNLSKSPNNKFCVEDYSAIKYKIDGYSKANKLDFIWEENLLKSLDYTYTPIFLSQAYYVFNGNEWEINKLNTIRLEVKNLIASKNIDNKTDLIKVKEILSQYDKIVSFISRANSFASELKVRNIEEPFDIDMATNFIKDADKYHNLKEHANNCTRLQSQLENIPDLMYNMHLNFLSKKVELCIGKYSTVPNYPSYFDSFRKPIFSEFKLYEDNFSSYSVSFTKLEGDLQSLKDRMNQEDKIAKSYKY